jgi:maleylacetoacetate isomerase
MKLHGYFRSSAAYRVRIALALKGVAYENAFVHLVRGEQSSPANRRINPQGRVPTLEIDGANLVQSPAILEYLEEAHPEPPLLPADPIARARIRAVGAIVACDIHPLNNLAVLKYLKHELGADDSARDAWYAHWILEGFAAIEELIDPAPFALSESPSLADVYLAPQIYNSRRFDVPMDAFPRIRAVASACDAHPAFQAAAPENQPDAA